MIKKIDHVNIVVSDLEGAKKFFLLMGFTLREERILKGAWFDELTQFPNAEAKFASLTLPETQINVELIAYKNPSGTTDPHISELNQMGFRHLAFQVTQIEKLVGELKKKGVCFLSGVQEYKANNKKLCYFLGPEGIVLELCEYSVKDS